YPWTPLGLYCLMMHPVVSIVRVFYLTRLG
ncbi:MAG: hypothetical protein HLUCCO16_14040, partial [Phormidium sp. OSCR]